MKFFYRFGFILLLLAFSCTQTPDTKVKITELSFVIKNAKDGETVDLTKYNDITNFDVTIDKTLTLEGAEALTDIKGATLNIAVSGVTLKNIKNVKVLVAESVGNGSFFMNNCSIDSMNVYGGGIEENSCITLQKTTIKDLCIYKEVNLDKDDQQYLGFDIDTSTTIDKLTMIDSCVAFTSKESAKTEQIKDVDFGSISSQNSANVAFSNNIALRHNNNYCVASFSDSSFTTEQIPTINICVEAGYQSSKITKTFFKQACKFILGNVNSGTISDSDKFNTVINSDTTIDIKNMVDSVTITFDRTANGATGEMSSDMSVKNGYYKVPECTFAYAGYKFTNWTKADDSTTYKAGSLVKLTDNTTLKANWLQSYSIEYFSSDATCDLWKDKYIPPTTYTIEDAVTLPTDSDLSNDGYTFLAWYDGAGDSATQVESWGANSRQSNLKLYAKWQYISEVKNPIIINGNKHLTLKWTNPDDKNFDHVQITCESPEKVIDSTSDAGKNASYDFTNLTNGGYYTFNLVCCDKNNNRSAPKEISQYCGNYFDETTGNIRIKGIEYEKTKLVTVNDTTADIIGKGSAGAFPANRNVKLSPYSIGAYPVTQELYEAVMGTNPSNNTSDKLLPVECVSYLDATFFLIELSDLFGLNSYSDESGDLLTEFNGFRLPTEAEWEFAARGANTSSDSWNMEYSGSDDIDSVAWYASNSDKKSQIVGTKKPNSRRLYDMSGNVWEWCYDIYTEKLPTGTFINPFNDDGKQFVLRGGSYINEDVKITTRSSEFYHRSNKCLGFRMARNIVK